MINKEEIIQIRKIIRDEFWELLDTEVFPALKDFLKLKLESSKNDSMYDAESLLGLLRQLARERT